MRVSKAMTDVWKWKEEVYQETKDMSREEVIAYFRGATKRLEEKTGKKLDLPRASRRRRRP